MPILTADNHFRFGYDYDWYVPRVDATQRFTVAYGSAQRMPLDWRSECLITAAKIAGDATGPIELLLSGGIDSEVAAQSFLAAKVPFTAHILRFADDRNDHDIAYAIRFCETHEVRYVLHDLDILQFFEADLYRYAEASKSVSPQFCATMWLIDQLNGYPVFGQGEPLLVPRPTGRWALRESEKVNAWYRYFLHVGRDGVPGFHQYTAEQMYSFLVEFVNHPMMAANSGKRSSLTSKYGMYTRHFTLEPRPKYNGYEKIMDHDAIHRERLMQLYPAHDDACHIDFQFILEHLRGHVAEDVVQEVAPP